MQQFEKQNYIINFAPRISKSVSIETANEDNKIIFIVNLTFQKCTQS